jgi:phosphoribosyl-ATP pyrophosphohydrolase/phosphoribosyl-AMP cyclohydrolase
MTDSQPATDLPIRFSDDRLVPVVIQDSATNSVLMVAFMNAAALTATRATGRVHFWSRSRQTLWRKGETSGHEQFVDEIFVNCDQNSLLVKVRQVGAVCHDGYDTCFYRRLDEDGTLAVTRERSFDPATVYGAAANSDDELAERSRDHYQAFAYLRDHDLSRDSGTSARLRSGDMLFHQRIADELRELAGVLSGEHRHTDRRSDLILEASQVLYWITLAALSERIAWSALRPDRALSTRSDELAVSTLVKMLEAEADRWTASDGHDSAGAACLHAALALVGQAILSEGITPLELIETDLAQLYAKPYMASYLADVTLSK